MGNQKLPISKIDLTKIDNEMSKLKGTPKENVYKVFLLLRYTGMHISVITLRKNDLKEVIEEGIIRIVWKRPKKVDAKAITKIKKHRNIYFDVNDFVKEIRNSRSKNSRLYFYRQIVNVSIISGVPGVSPNTFRHTLAVSLLDDAWSEQEVAQLLNCSVKTLREWYGKKPQVVLDKKLTDLGW